MGKPHRRIAWRLGEVIEVKPETPRTNSLILGRASPHLRLRPDASCGGGGNYSGRLGTRPRVREDRTLRTHWRLELWTTNSGWMATPQRVL
jgi:hypothetical protein